MRSLQRLLPGLTSIALALACATSAFAQVHPVDDPRPHPIVTNAPIASRTLPPPFAAQSPQPGAPSTNPGQAAFAGNPNVLGPQMPLALLRLPALPAKTMQNTLYYSGPGQRHTMSALPNSVQYSTGANCGSTVGYIFNSGCTISFQMSWCDASMASTPCSQDTIARTDTFQDYYIDATSGTAQSIGSTYVPGSCCANTSYGPSHSLTLNNVGTVVLAAYDVTKGTWISIVYITVANASGVNTYLETYRYTPQTNFTSGSVVYIAATGYGVNNNDYYAYYVESTGTNVQCVAVIPGGTSASGPCNVSTAAQQLKATLNSNGLYAVNAQWTAASTVGTYSIVLWDISTGRRLGQTQVAVNSTAGASINFTPNGGNASPNPLPAATPGSRFAFNSTSDQSDSGININMSGLTSGRYYCFSISDPQGRVYQSVSAGNFSYTCGSPSGSTLSLGDTFLNYKSPLNFAANTYTVSVYDSTTTAVVASRAFQLLGYNATTNFTNAAGTSTTGTALLLPKNSSSVGGLQFINDGDSYYGSGNGDALSAIQYNTGTSGITITLPCGTCTSETVTDSAGVSWTVSLTNVGSGSNAGTVLTLTPATSGQKLAMNASITLPNLTFNNAPGASGCTTSCTANTSILPTDGQTWSSTGSTVATNATYFTNSNNTAYAGTTDFTHLGITAVGSPYTGGAKAGEEDHGYYPRMSQSLYNVNSPFSAAANSYADVYSMTVTNNSSVGSGNITGIAVYWPTNYSPGAYGTTVSVDGSTPTTWALDTSTACPTGNNGFCLKPSSSNTGIAPSTAQTIYVDLQNLPPVSFAYTDFNIQAYSPVSFTLTPSGTKSVFVGSVSSVDNTAVGTYSLDASLMSAYLTPTSEGTNTNNTVAVTVQNTGSSQDPYPDWVDAVVIELPNGVANTASFSGITNGWLYLGSAAGLASNTTDYWFGLCSSQFNTADGPKQNPPPVNPSLPQCSQTTEQTYSLQPSKQFTFNTTMQTGATAGTIAGTMYAHGANGNGWTKGKAFNLTVSTVAATAGFTQDGTYGSPSTIPTNTTPQIGADSNTTYGNSFVYEIANTSASGNNVNSAVITVPNSDTSGAQDTSTAGYWTITAAPTLSGSGWTHCQVNAWSSASSSGNGSITIGNDSTGTCTITSGGKLDVSFPMKAPYKPNDSWAFPTKVNSTISAAENWTGDTYMNTIVSAQLAITVWPTGTGPGGSNPSPSCTRTCNYNQSAFTLDMGAIANTQSNTGTDVVLVTVYTNAATPVGWGLYVSTNNNPANTGSPTNELLTSLDNTAGRQPAYTGISYPATTLAVMPTGSPGTQIVRATSQPATRNPYDFLQNMQVNIQGGTTTGQTSTVTYTWISN